MMGKEVDLTGQKFGKLLVVEKSEKPITSKNKDQGRRYWKCLCECGKEKIVLGTSLKNGSTKSCGCLYSIRQKDKTTNGFIDLSGKIFGKLLVLNIDHIDRSKNGLDIIYWNCKCDCGNSYIVRGQSLRDGKTRSCGCWRRKILADSYTYESHLVSIYKQYQTGAKGRNILFDLTIEEFGHIISEKCFYCGKAADKSTRKKDNTVMFFYTGIDRIDNNKGYSVDNCVPSCTQCNKSKLDYSQYEFYSWIKRVYEYNFINKER